MPDPETSIPLILATLLSGLAFALSARHVRLPEDHRPSALLRNFMLGTTALICVAVFIYRVAVVHQAWQPLQAHVDGLLLIAALLAFAILYTQTRPRLFGFSLFAMPLLSLILAWGVCASLWTFRPFNLTDEAGFAPAWRFFHTVATYLGLLSCGFGAAAGAMYLFVQRRVQAKAHLGQVNPMASLETLENLIIRTATLGFVLLTLSLISGMIIVTQTDQATSLGESWWASSKVWLAAAAWLVYALLINVRSFSSFRGRRAAWLAIAGLALVIATYGAVEAIGNEPASSEAQTPSPQPDPEEAD